MLLCHVDMFKLRLVRAEASFLDLNPSLRVQWHIDMALSMQCQVLRIFSTIMESFGSNAAHFGQHNRRQSSKQSEASTSSASTLSNQRLQRVFDSVDVFSSMKSSMRFCHKLHTIIHNQTLSKGLNVLNDTVDTSRSLQAVQHEHLRLWERMLTSGSDVIYDQVVSSGICATVVSMLDPRTFRSSSSIDTSTEETTDSMHSCNLLCGDHPLESESLSFLQCFSECWSRDAQLLLYRSGAFGALRQHLMTLVIGSNAIDAYRRQLYCDNGRSLSRLLSCLLILDNRADSAVVASISLALGGVAVPDSLRGYAAPTQSAALEVDDFTSCCLNESHFMRVQKWLHSVLKDDVESVHKAPTSTWTPRRADDVDDAYAAAARSNNDTNTGSTRAGPARVILQFASSKAETDHKTQPSESAQSTDDVSALALANVPPIPVDDQSTDKQPIVDIVSMVDAIGDDIIDVQAAFDRHSSSAGRATVADLRAALSDVGCPTAAFIANMRGAEGSNTTRKHFAFEDFLRFVLRYRRKSPKTNSATDGESIPRSRTPHAHQRPSPRRMQQRLVERATSRQSTKKNSSTFQGGVGTIAGGLFPRHSWQYQQAVAAQQRTAIVRQQPSSHANRLKATSEGSAATSLAVPTDDDVILGAPTARSKLMASYADSESDDGLPVSPASNFAIGQKVREHVLHLLT